MKRIRLNHNNSEVLLCADEYTASDANILTVMASSNCPQGGDSGHGGRTYFALVDEANTDLNVRVNDGHWQEAGKIEVMLGGDSENTTFRNCLSAALKMLGGEYVRPAIKDPTPEELEAERMKAEDRLRFRKQPVLSRAEHVALGRDLFALKEHLGVLGEIYSSRADVKDAPPQVEWVRRAFHDLASAISGAGHDAIQEAIAAYGLEFAAKCYVRDGDNVAGMAGPLMPELARAGTDFGTVVARKLNMCSEL
jgi:hypothetical protein